MRTPTDLHRLPTRTIPAAVSRGNLRVRSRLKPDYSLGAPTVAVLLCALLSLFGGRAQATVGPIISPIPDLVANEDEPILHVPFTVWDADSPPERLTFTTFYSLTNNNNFSRDNIVIGGSGSNRWFSIYPLPDGSGPALGSITVRDETGLSATALFHVQVYPVNDPPRLSAIPDQMALKGQGFLSVLFWVYDPETSVSRLRLTAWSSRPAVVSNSDLRLIQGTTQTNRNLLISLPPNGTAGSTAITIQADDGQSTNTTSFVLNVQPPDFTRSTDLIPAGGEGFTPVWGDFNGDGLLDLVVSPSQIYTNRGNGLFSAGIQLPAGTVASGATAADFDGDGNLDLLFYGTGTPRLLRNSGGPAPAFSEIPVNWAAFSPFGGRLLWADMDGDGALDIVGGSTQIRWLQNDGAGGFTDVATGVPSFTQSGVSLVAIGDMDNDGDPDILARVGTATVNPTLRLYLNDGTGHLVDSQVSLPQRYTSAGGWVDVDGDGLLDLWLLQFLQSPAASISSNSLVVLRQDRGRFVESFRLTDPTATVKPFIPLWGDFDNDGNVDFVGPYWPPQPLFTRRTNYPALYRNDGNGQFTTTGLPLLAANFGQLATPAADFDDDGSPDLLFPIGNVLAPLRNQARAINALPDAPTGLHAFLAGNVVMLFWNDAADANQTAALSYNVRLGTKPGKNDVVASMSATNGTRMISTPGNAGYKNWLMLNLILERFHVETLYWTVQAVDNGFQGGPFAPEQTFTINPPGNQPPVISGISDLTIPEDTTNTVTLYVADDRTPPDLLHVQATSSNTNLFPSARVKLSGFTVTNQELKVNLSLAPLADRSGLATITVTATDRGGLSTSRFFFVTVTPVNDPPVLTAPDTLLGLAGASTPALPIQVSDLESSTDQLVVTARSLTPGVVPDSNLMLNRLSGGNWSLVATPAGAEPGQAQIELTVTDPQGAQTKRTVNVILQRELPTLFASFESWPNQFIWADLNGDRQMELFLGNAIDWGLTVHSVQPGSLPVVAQLTPPMTEGTPVDVADFDNDGDVDVLADISPLTTTRKLVVFRNLGNFAFEQVPGAVFDPGAARFADFDQDGRLDVWVATNPTNLVVYRNNGIGFDAARRLELIAPPSPELEAATGLDVIDLDGDAIPELIVSRYGYLSGNRRQSVYRRKGDSFEAISSAWTQNPIQDIVDFDQDQLPDLVSNSGGSGSVQVRRNNGNLNFSTAASLFSSGYGAAASADFDGDGIPDVLGSSLFLGSTGMVFTRIEVPFGTAYVQAVAPADFDGDGVMDFAAKTTSSDPSVPNVLQFAVYRGQSRRVNHPPTSPSNLLVTALATNTIMLSWSRATDPEQSGGLTYNVRVGTTRGVGDVVSPMSLADGFRLVPRRGNAWWNTNFFVTSLQPGRTYYWSVQAVDNSFAGGPFAAEASFTMPDAVLALRPAGTRGIELELRAAPTHLWEVEMSNDLRTWQEYPTTGMTMQTGTNGVNRLKIEATSERRFFRARRVD